MVTVKTRLPDSSSDAGLDLESWVELLGTDRSANEVETIRRACLFASQAHAGQIRVSGEPYVQHVLAVAGILAELRLDAETVVAAILHDVVEDTDVRLADVEQVFGHAIATLVDGVTKMHFIHAMPGPATDTKTEHTQAESLRKMLLAMAEDVRVVLIKLADRLHNMRTLEALTPGKQQRIARETMDIFAPLANRLGIWQIKWELDDLAFRYLEPAAYKHIASALAERRVDRERYIERFVTTLKQELSQTGIRAEVTGRAKHIFGIWRKMRRKRQDFAQIYDVRAVRVLVETLPQCYAALGIVHTLWQYLPGEFDDYIATPKENNYRSIHTAVIGPEGKVVEVQIRTRDMNRQAELGVAAHWRYKEGVGSDASFDGKIAWLRQLLEWKEEVAEASEFVDQFKSEVFQDRVYVFTPRGNVVDLPRGARPIDFAYQIHTEVGHRCRGAKVNGRMVPLTYQLKTGEQVEVLTVKKGGPSRDWLNPHLGYLKTSKARSRVQTWLRQQNHERNVADGRASLERELKRMGFADVSLERLAQKFKYGKVDEFLAATGRGEVKPARVINVLQEGARPEPEPVVPAPPSTGTATAPPASAIQVHGVGNLVTRMAGCCRPVPGEAIIGYITQGHGVTIHRRDCHKVLACVGECPERLVEVDWGDEPSGTYPVQVQILAFDRQGLLRDVTTVLANEAVNVVAVNTHSYQATHTARMVMTLEIADLDVLSRVLARINQLPNVVEVRRKVD